MIARRTLSGIEHNAPCMYGYGATALYCRLKFLGSSVMHHACMGLVQVHLNAVKNALRCPLSSLSNHPISHLQHLTLASCLPLARHNSSTRCRLPFLESSMDDSEAAVYLMYGHLLQDVLQSCRPYANFPQATPPPLRPTTVCANLTFKLIRAQTPSSSTRVHTTPQSRASHPITCIT